MIQFLLAAQNVPFVVAYAIMLAFGVLAVLSGALDHGHGHDADVDVDVDADVDVDVDHDADFHLGDHLFTFFGIGKVPITMLVMSFAWAFGSCGYITQFIARSAGFQLLSPWTASLIALVPALIVHHFVARLIAHFTSSDDSTAIHSDTFVGKTATVVLAETAKGKPTQAKLRDQHGQTHYLLVEPHRDDDLLKVGDEVILVARNGSLYEAMPNDIDLIASHLRVGESPKETP